MNGHLTRPTRESPVSSMSHLELTEGGYLRICREDAEHCFPEDTLLALWKDDSLWLLPTRGRCSRRVDAKTEKRSGRSQPANLGSL